MSSAQKKKIAVIDANALIHRSFHAMPALTSSRGELVNAVYGFASTLLSVLEKIKPDYLACAFDAAKKTFRHEKYAKYKATRQKAPQELYDQIPRVKELVQSMNIPIFEKAGFEADDIIGTLVKNCSAKGVESYIVTGDKDAFQLVNPRVKVFTLRRGIKDTIIYDAKEVTKKMGVRPDQLVDYKALAGDPSDNIPGVPGVGDKTAVNILNAWGDLDNLYKAVESVEACGRTPHREIKQGKCTIKGKVLESLTKHKGDAYLSRDLAKIRQNIPLPCNLPKMAVADYDREKVISLFQDLGFRSLLGRLPESSQKNKTTPRLQANLFEKKGELLTKIKMPAGYYIIKTSKELAGLITKLKRQKAIAVDTETDVLDPINSHLVGISISFKDGEGYYLPVGHQEKVLDREKTLKALKPILENRAIKKIGHNLKYDYMVLKNHGIDMHNLHFDTMIASYVLNPGERGHGLDNLAFTELKYEMLPITRLIGTGRSQISFKAVPVGAAAFYSVEDADMTWRLKSVLAKKIKKITAAQKKQKGFLDIKGSLEKIFADLEMPLIKILSSMELAGIKINPAFLKKKGRLFGEKIKKLEERICKLAGQKFNINSTQQLSEILFTKLKIPTEDLKKTPGGVISTSADELAKIKKSHPVVFLVEQYRELTKLKSTYIDALPQLIRKKTGRVHTSFNQTVTATGRLSSSNPNLQNIPIRTEEGRVLREAFVADRGYELLSVDYSQIDLRIMAHISGDPKMIKVFKAGGDIHTSTAAEIFDILPDKVDKEKRRVAKTVNFGVIYGMSPYGLSRTLDISRAEARDFIERYFQKYPAIRKYVADIIAYAGKTGYTETLLGRRRYIPEIRSGQSELRGAAERMAINMPVQGTSADIIKIAMINLARAGLVNNREIRLLLQVHDELVFEIKKDKFNTIAPKICTLMESAYKLSVPLLAHASIGDNWGQMTAVNSC